MPKFFANRPLLYQQEVPDSETCLGHKLKNCGTCGGRNCKVVLGKRCRMALNVNWNFVIFRRTPGVLGLTS